MSITTLRPTGVDQTWGVVTVVGTGNAATVTANGPADDSTYITSAFFGHGVALAMTDITLTGTQRPKQVRIRLRELHNSADVGWVEYVDVRIRSSVTGKTNAAVWNTGTSSDTATEKTSFWWTTDPDGKTWTDTGVDRVESNIAWRARDTTKNGNPQITQLRITEVYMDVDVHSQFVLTSVTASNFATSTRPAWAFVLQADPDNDPQIRYQIKVFSSAQYSAAGFNPDTSANVWNSGIISSDATSGTVGVDLINGVTYKIYARAAKAWVPSGTLWWSDWTPSSAFTVNTTPPIIPTLTVTQLLDLPWYRNLVEATAPVNLLTGDEASFDFSSVGGWANDTNTTAPTVSATNPKSGAGSMTMSSVAAGTMAVAAPIKAARPGLTYTAGASFRAAVSARSVQVLIRWKRGATTLSTVTGSTSTDGTGGYTSVTASGTAPAGTDGVQLVAQVVSTGAAAEVHRVDEAFIHAGSTTAYSPGGLGTTQTVPLERGERVSTGRGPALNWAHPQVWSGGTEQRDPTKGFQALSAADTLAWEPIDVSLDGPAGMIHWSVRSGTSTAMRVGDAVDPLSQSDYWFPIVPSSAHTFSLWAWADVTFNTRLNIDWLDAAGGTISTVNGTTVNFTGTPTQWTFTATAPSNAVFARGSVANLGSSNTANVFLTRVGWGLGSTAVDDQVPRGGALVWNTVRELTEFGDPVQPGEQLQLLDAEAAPGRPVVYRCRTLATYSTDLIASDYSNYVPVYLTPPTRSLLKDPFQPERSIICNVWPEDNTSLVEETTELHGMGRDLDPVFISTWHGEQRSLDLSALSHSDLGKLLRLLSSVRPLLFQWPEGGQEYVRITSWSYVRTRPGIFKTISLQGSVTGSPS